MRLKPAIAEYQITRFSKRFGEAHLLLARHAAFPLALTPDLLYRIWANFQRNARGTLLSIPWVAVADLLLSNLCDAVGPELYEMDDQVRETLLGQLKADDRFGPDRVNELAEFLLDYIRRQLGSDDPDIRDFAKAQQVTALAYTKPSRAAAELAKALAAMDQTDSLEVLRLTSLIEADAEPLAGFKPLLTYARGMSRYARGDLKAAAVQFDELGRDRSQISVEGVSLPIPGRTRRTEVQALIDDLESRIAARDVLVIVGPDVPLLATGRKPFATWSGRLKDGLRRVAGGRPASWVKRIQAELSSGDPRNILHAADAISGAARCPLRRGLPLVVARDRRVPQGRRRLDYQTHPIP